MCGWAVGERFKSVVGDDVTEAEDFRHCQFAPRWLPIHIIFQDFLITFASDEYRACWRKIGDAFAVADRDARGCRHLGRGIALEAFQIDTLDGTRCGVLVNEESEEAIGDFFIGDDGVAVVAERGDTAIVACSDAPFGERHLSEVNGLLR